MKFWVCSEFLQLSEWLHQLRRPWEIQQNLPESRFRQCGLPMRGDLQMSRKNLLTFLDVSFQLLFWGRVVIVKNVFCYISGFDSLNAIELSQTVLDKQVFIKEFFVYLLFLSIIFFKEIRLLYHKQHFHHFWNFVLFKMKNKQIIRMLFGRLKKITVYVSE